MLTSETTLDILRLSIEETPDCSGVDGDAFFLSRTLIEAVIPELVLLMEDEDDKIGGVNLESGRRSAEGSARRGIVIVVN